MELDHLLTAADRDRIADAAGRAEERTSGEIVPYLVAACDDYDGTCWKAGALGAMVLALVAGATHQLGGFWAGWSLAWISLPAVVGAAAGYVTARWVAPVRRWLVPSDVLELRVRRRAMTAFVEDEVFATRDRTGILLFVALFEHRVVVLGDEGINRAVDPGEWNGIVETLVDEIRAGRLVDGLVEAIEACGELLVRHQVDIRPDDIDELSNEPRIRDR
jgi:putative membrane protein